MNITVLTKKYDEIPFSKNEILRYAGSKTVTPETETLLTECVEEAKNAFSLKVCYCTLPVTIKNDTCDFSLFEVTSNSLSKNLKDAKSVVIFGATIGVEIDRLISKYGILSPSKALFFQAIGAERIEALCDKFCEDIAKEQNALVGKRFSAGYGDLDLSVQKDIFRILDCYKNIGLSLNDSLLMSPSKSVTAFLGIK